MATPVSCSPNNNYPTSEGTISNANPAAASPIAAKINTLIIRPRISVRVVEGRSSLARLIVDGAIPLGDPARPPPDSALT